MCMQSFVALRCGACVLRKPRGFLDARELIPTTRTTTVAFWDPPSGSKKSQWRQLVFFIDISVCSKKFGLRKPHKSDGAAKNLCEHLSFCMSSSGVPVYRKTSNRSRVCNKPGFQLKPGATL